ncbi:MAG: MotA/TolQ/ExbB proton channel family protein [Alphaproteobacteria bacterium]|nr:MotA/TolQ/ExbB proton channel family protein [Alphaproteobacteria bacterium]
MTGPRRYLLRMAVFLALVAAGGALILPALVTAFKANVALNAMILAVLALGIAYAVRQVLTLAPEVAWIEAFRAGQQTGSLQQPRLLGPLATMLAAREARTGVREGRMRFSLSPPAMRSLHDSIQTRLDEQRDIARYMVGLLIFLGLLGTFWGLMQVVHAVGDTIATLSVDTDNTKAMLSSLKDSLSEPLAGMGTAFSTSLFGLGGSLVLGFLEMQAGQAQNRFANELEEWLSSATRLSGGSFGGDGDVPIPAYIQALLEQAAESLETLQRTLAQSDTARADTHASLGALAQGLGHLVDQMQADQHVLRRLADDQSKLRASVAQLADAAQSGSAGLDEATRIHIRNADLQLGRLADSMDAVRREMAREVSSGLKLLARTIAASTEPGER